jgi:phosphatidylethanolamine-binding protein (PEBP) family uncharacterized protein
VKNHTHRIVKQPQQDTVPDHGHKHHQEEKSPSSLGSEKPAKASKYAFYAFDPAVRNMAAVMHTVIGDLSTRESPGD